jgi:general stress protein 26
MTVPVTTLDQEHSDSRASATGWTETLRLLQDAELFWVSTVRSSGKPHVTPVVGLWADDALHFFSGATEQKVANLKVNQRVALTTGCNGWDRGIDVVVEGIATRLTDLTALTSLAERWSRKWDGRWQFVVRDGCYYHTYVDDDGMQVQYPHAIEVFSVRPAKILAFDKAAESHTTHRF